MGPSLRDFGRGSDLFLPSHAAWLYPQQLLEWATDKDLRRVKQSGRVLELLLNGRFESSDQREKRSPLEQKDSLKKILEALFINDGNPEDAPAMIRRISPSFDVVIE